MIQIPDQHVTFFARTCSFNDDLATSQSVLRSDWLPYS